MDNWVKELGTTRRSGWEFCEVSSPEDDKASVKNSRLTLYTFFDLQAIKDIVHLIPDTPDFVYTVRYPTYRCAQA